MDLYFELRRLVVCVIFLACLLKETQQQTFVLNPAYFNVAEGKNIQATATCGEGFSFPGERYCKLTGNTADVFRPGEQEIIQGQYCDYCEPNNLVKAHPIQHAIDGTEKWWQSPPLSRLGTGIDFNHVNVTIDLGQLYHVAYIIIKSANSPRPGQWILERSRDYGDTYEAWQYFAESESECQEIFGMESITDIINDNDVVCTSDYSDIVPLEDGEIVVSLVNDRPGADNFSYSETLQEWTKATNIRLRLLRTNTLLGHLMGLARQDPTVTRRYYYSIKDISIGGRCVCNGHADTCDTPGPDDRLICTCSHNTCGSECEICCPGFVQKKWKPATLEDSNECEPCNCHEHSSDCYYDEEVSRNRLSLDISGRYDGGGVCIDCQHNTAGVNCELCEDGYYRLGNQALESASVCEACDCDPYFSTGNCAPITGQCECRPRFTGPDCGECNEGYYDFPTCKPCDCNINGTENKVCLPSGGQCPCKVNYGGQFCDQCERGFYDFPACLSCDCDRSGSRGGSCDEGSGQCRCRDTYGGRTCDECANGFYGFPNCQDCSCSPFGVTDEVCEPSTGACICKVNFEGRCDTCAVGYYGFPECRECGCDSKGSQYEGCSEGGQCYCQAGFDGLKCDMCANGYYRYPDCFACDCSRSGSRSILCVELTGQCSCRRGYQGRTCDSCAEGFYNYPNCEECNCDPAGVIERPGQPTGRCGQTQGACTCKANVIGRACDSCAPLYYNLQRSNPAGCESCDCFIEGTVSGLAVCDVTSGQCLCKAAVGGQQCHECKDGYYRLEAGNAFGCVDCGCDVGGSISNVCDKNTGQCVCRARVSGRNCAQPAQLHFFPSLHQIKFEIESGFTPSGTRPRIGYDNKEFPEFSYLGYAVMSSIQPVVMVSIDVDRQSIYRIVLRYLYDGSSPATGRITLTPSSGDIGSEQISNIVFIPGPDPQFVTIEGGGVIMPFVLNRGEWTARIEAPEGALLDYLVLLPSAFYEATVLIQSVADPCIPNAEQERCNYYVFPSYDKYPNARGVDGLYYNVNTGQYIRVTPFADEFIRDELDVIDLAHLDEDQNNIHLTMEIDHPGEYVFVVEYYGGGPGQQMGTITVTDGQNRMQGIVNFYNCSYLCRSVVVSPRGDLEIFNIENNQISVVLDQLGDPFFLAVSSVIAIPVDNFHYDFITPSLECVRTASGECLGSNHPIPPDSTMIDFVDPTGQDPKPPNMFIPTTTVRYISTTDGITNVYVEIHLLPPGEYVFVVHYYQPENSGFDVNFRILGEFDSEGIFNAGYCPHISGCRVAVTLPDGSNEIDLTGLGQSIEVSIPGGGNHTLWIDYILAIPADQYTDDILNEIPLDRAGEFITFCGSDNFFITASSPDLCKDAVFSISTEFNNGAFPCDCNPAGSRRFECEPIGGQCSCRANVVGRQCDGCSIGYYNFPACRPCRCPTGVCNEVTGNCECPQNVVGNQCDQCAVATYGYDPLAGCVDCDCDDRGNLGSEECDPVSGQCRCKPNVGGRRCDQCLPGYYQYPLCLKCDCESAGTLSQICDQVTAQCLCKDNVIGEQCDQCPVGTFDLSEGNTQGCLSCFCFGVTDDCKSYTRSRQPIAFREEWQVTNLANPLIRYSGGLVNVYVNGEGDQPTEAIYWIPPSNFFGNQLNSYGGRLSFRVMNNPKEGRGDLGGTGQPIRRPDVVIGGNGITIMYSNLEPPQPSSSLTMDIKLIEENFQYSFSGRPVSRAEFMMVIGNIDQFEIRAQYFDSIVDSSLSDIVFETTHRDGNGDSASSVERCRCPPEYTGLSCERCAQGHYRIIRGTFLGQCVPCQCNNHTNECDEETGYCLNCEDDTSGAQCQTCRTGYHGNALSPREGCEVCACPRPLDEHNYAETCGFDANNNQYCICLEGHTGKYCDMCEDGYYGDPSKPNSQCQQCDCSENSDSSLFGPECDSLYGNCLRCRPDTTGENCEDCADWYYGDAVNRKDCRPCDCDRYGSDSCDRSTGQCTCKPNVVGPRCDRCEANYYNFESGFGCTPCECGLASLGSQCDLSTGECECRPGVEGRNCDQCSEGFYQYSRQGCRACSCAANLRCDPDTGECLCPEGAIGPNCDQCEDRYVLTKDGCLPCDDCVHLLLDILEDMDFGVSANVSIIPNISVGLDTIKRLKAINESIADIKNYTVAMESNNQKVRPEIEDSSDNLDDLKKIAKRILKGASRADDKSDDLANDTATTLQRAKDILAKIENAFNSIKEQAGNMTHPMLNQTEDFDDLLQRALEILEEIRGRNHSGMVDESDVELEAAKELLDRVLGLTNASSGIVGRLMNVSKKLDDFIDKLEELNNLTAEARDIIDAVNDTIDFPTDIKSIGDEITDIYTMSGDEIDRALDLLDQAREYLLDAAAAVEVTGANASALSSAHNKLETEYGPLKDALNVSRELVANAMAHAVNLTAQADYLERLLVSTKELAENALNAANAYKDIVSAIEEAEKAALAAKNASTLAEEAASGFGNKPQKSLKLSNKLVKKGEKTNKSLGALEAELNASSDAVRQARDKNNGVEYDLSEIERGMRAIPSEESDCEIKVCALDNDACKPGFTGANCNVAAFSDQALDATMQAMDASMRAEAAAGMVGGIIDQLPLLESLVTTLIPEGVIEANRNIDEIQPQNRKSRKFLDKIPGLAQSLTDKHEMFVNISSNVLGNLDYLREQIDNARSLAQGIQIAAKLESDSSIQLRSLQLSDGPQSVSSISMYFTTTKPDALLFFAGGPGASEEYLALEIEKSEIKLKYNLGDVDVEVPLAMNVADGQWHQVVVERVGKKGRLIVYSDFEGAPMVENEGTSAGENSLLHWGEGWGIFVGGIGENFTAPGVVNVNPFVGGIDTVIFNQEPLGIWNFENADHVNQGIIRNVTDLAEKPNPDDSGGTSFDGTGYVKIHNPKDFGKSFNFGLSFKTQSVNGLIFFGGKGADYISIEIRGGRVVVTLSINGEFTKMTTSEKHNKKIWTSVDLSRYRDTIELGVFAAGKAPERFTEELGTSAKLKPIKFLFFGGLVGIKDTKYPMVTRKPFNGCIKTITLTRESIDLLENIKSKGIFPDCIQRDIRLVSFPAPNGGYVKMTPVDFYSRREFLFSFRAHRPTGLLVYLSDSAHEDVMAVQLNNGTVEATFGKEVSMVTKVKSGKDTYNDGNWHTVNIIKESNRDLKLRIDDEDEDNGNFRIRSSVVTDGQFFVGGLPKSLTYNVNVVPDLQPFVGCISDVGTDQEVQNFADRVGDSSASFGFCPDEAIVVSETPPDIFGTSTPFPEIETTPPSGQCKLGFGEAANVDPSDSGAVYFGATNESRYEYQTFGRDYSDSDTVSFSLKTAASYAILYYTADDNQYDFTALYLNDGYLVYSFDYGSGSVLITSSSRVNDNQWHMIKTLRDGRDGEILVDDETVATGYLQGPNKYLLTDTPLYVGGLPPDLVINDIPVENRESLIGCIKDFDVQPEPRDLQNEFEVPACPGLREPGVFFGSNGGYVVLSDEFSVGIELTMTFDIKPRKSSGTIFSIQKPNMDFLALELREGQLFLSVQNGGGEFMASYSPANGEFSLCNGQWHSIEVVKDRFEASITVDGEEGIPGVSDNPAQTETNTNDPLYFGGVPDGEVHDGILENESFGGCIRNIVINSKSEPVVNKRRVGEVDLRSCPAN